MMVVDREPSRDMVTAYRPGPGALYSKATDNYRDEDGLLKGVVRLRGQCGFAGSGTNLLISAGLMLKTAGLVDVLADALKPLAAKLRIAFVYGSIASNKEQSDSDIDLMVVGSVAPAELALPLRHAREILGREINPTVYTLAEFNKKRAAKDHFLTRVLDKSKLFVIGSKNELGEVAG
jgi:predicted nucleotidyltransferase